ncbi:MAG: hypothetical protein ACFFCW_22020 [Candidatus Hodarchaeota archaeon]
MSKTEIRVLLEDIIKLEMKKGERDRNMEVLEEWMAFRSPVDKLEDDLGLERNSLLAFADDDDWAFIIKSHAFLEATLTQFLTDYFEEERLQDIFAYVELGNVRSGKMAFLKALGFLKPEEERFLRKFSELRNELVHNVKNIYFNLDKHVASFDKNQRESFVKAFGYSHPLLYLPSREDFEESLDMYKQCLAEDYPGELTPDGVRNLFKNKAEELTLKQPKTAILLCILNLIESIHRRHRKKQRNREMEKRLETLEEKLEQTKESKGAEFNDFYEAMKTIIEDLRKKID